LEQENDAKRMSVADAIGFYPTGDQTNIELIVGTSDKLESDAATDSDLKLTVQLNSDAFKRALDRKAVWEKTATIIFCGETARRTSRISDAGRRANPQTGLRGLSARFWLGPISGSHQGQRPQRPHRTEASL
jgi:hypothetical protein